MRLLLDTQVVVWALDSPAKLNRTMAAGLQDPKNQLFVSWLSLWEIKIKAARGKLVYFQNTPELLDKMNVQIIMPDLSLLRSYRIFNRNNTDPFDNTIIALAKNNGFILATSDHEILSLPSVVVRTLRAN